MVKFGYKYVKYMIGVFIKCTNHNTHVYCDILDIFIKKFIKVFIKSVVFHHVGLLWLIQTKDNIEFDGDKICAHWCKERQ